MFSGVLICPIISITLQDESDSAQKEFMAGMKKVELNQGEALDKDTLLAFFGYELVKQGQAEKAEPSGLGDIPEESPSPAPSPDQVLPKPPQRQPPSPVPKRVTQPAQVVSQPPVNNPQMKTRQKVKDRDNCKFCTVQ